MSTTVRFQANTDAKIAIAAPDATPLDFFYQNSSNTFQSNLDVIHGTEYVVDLKNATWGTTSTDEIINSYPFIEDMYVTMEVEIPCTSGKIPYFSNFCGFTLIDEISIQFPGNIEHIRYSGTWLANEFVRRADPKLLLHLQKLVKMQEKYVDLSWNTPDSGSYKKASMVFRDDHLMSYSSATQSVRVLFVVPIPLGSSLHSFGDSSLATPFPIYALQNPLKISIRYAPIERVIQNIRYRALTQPPQFTAAVTPGAGGAASTVSFNLQALSKAENSYFGEQILSYTVDDLKNAMKKATYRFIYGNVYDTNMLKKASITYPLSFVSEDSTNVIQFQDDPTSTTLRTVITKSGIVLAQMRTAEIKEIWVKALTKTDFDAGRYYNTLPLTGCTVTYAGQKIINFYEPEFSYYQMKYGNKNYAMASSRVNLEDNLQAYIELSEPCLVAPAMSTQAMTQESPIDTIFATDEARRISRFNALTADSGLERVMARPSYQYVIPFSWLSTAQMGDKNYVRGIPFAPNQVQLMFTSDSIAKNIDIVFMVQYRYVSKMVIQGGSCNLVM